MCASFGAVLQCVGDAVCVQERLWLNREWIGEVFTRATAEGYLAGEWEETQLPMDVLLDLVESDWLLGVMCATGEAVGGQLEEARAELQLGREV